MADLTAKERAWVAVLIKQAPRDSDYMTRWVNDPDAGFTRGICSRHEEMARWLERLLASSTIPLPPEAPK